MALDFTHDKGNYIEVNHYFAEHCAMVILRYFVFLPVSFEQNATITKEVIDKLLWLFTSSAAVNKYLLPPRYPESYHALIH